MDDFINRASSIPFMERAVKFAKRQRALGLGWLGWHSYLQNNMIPWESMEAKYKNVEIAKHIQKKALEASQKYAREYGEPELLKGYNRANVTTMAIAPTKSSSFILGQVSEGIEPFRSNYYIKDLAKGKFPVKNIYLEELLKKKDKNTDDVWDSILKRSGSVQHLDFLTEHEKAVFRTFAEISPMEIVIQAAARQPYIDQGQSLNLMIPQNTSVKDINKLMIEGWRMGLKTYYYQLGSNSSQNLVLDILSCKSCEA
jgi:ribonucleoside-diphosphate reductase alpha chain